MISVLISVLVRKDLKERRSGIFAKRCLKNGLELYQNKKSNIL